MARGWSATELAAIASLPLSDEAVAWTPIPADLGVGSFGVTAWTGDAGANVIGPHDENDGFAGGDEKLYLVFAGRATFRIGEGATEQTRQGLEQQPDSAELLYHQACYESLAGRLAEAREHLNDAIARDARCAERAAREPDLERLRG